MLCQLAQNQPKSHFLFHKNVSLHNFYTMTLVKSECEKCLQFYMDLFTSHFLSNLRDCQRIPKWQKVFHIKWQKDFTFSKYKSFPTFATVEEIAFRAKAKREHLQQLKKFTNKLSGVVTKNIRLEMTFVIQLVVFKQYLSNETWPMKMKATAWQSN